MTEYVKNSKGKWYRELMQRFGNLMSRLGLSQNESDQIKEFLLAIAREQYMTGNRCGIKYAHEQMGTARAS